MGHYILFAFWFLLPAGVANMVPVLTSPLPVLRDWKTPIDGGRTFRGKPLLGPNKTWRGLISGLLAATLVLWLQQLAVAHWGWAAYITQGVDFVALPTLFLGPLFGLGALGGDAIESFFKRQRGFKSGDSWLPFDQIDYVIGAVLVSLPFVRLPALEYAVIFIVWFVMHLATSYLGWLVGLKPKPI